MIKIENVVTPSPKQWRSAIMGARNAMNSWDRSDSEFEERYLEGWPHDTVMTFKNLGSNDHDLLMRLRNAGTDHRKFMRMLPVYADIIAPLYFWKEFSTYKVGTVANSCSTMHKIHAKEFTLEDFSHEHLNDDCVARICSLDILKTVIEALNYWRRRYLYTKNKDDWWQMIQLLPSSYNQKRTVMLNYEVLANIYKSRKNHKLDEWAEHSSSIPDSTSQALYSEDLPFGFCDWIKTLPYPELITGEHFLTHDEIMEKLDKWAKDVECEV